MAIKQYFPISVGFFVLVLAMAHYFGAPIAPFAAVLLAGETLLGFELEDHKATKLTGEFLKALKPTHK